MLNVEVLALKEVDRPKEEIISVSEYYSIIHF